MSMRGVESRLATMQGIQFTVNTAVEDAALSLVGAQEELSVSGGVRYLQEADNAIIKGFSLTFPYQFGQGLIGNAPIQVGLGWRDSDGNFAAVGEVGNGGTLNISDPNYWYDSNIYVPFPSTATNKWLFELTAILGNVSQINAPAVLNAEDLFCTFHLLIQSTLVLTG